KGRNVVERCFNKLKQWRGIAMRSDKTARSYHAAIALAATLIWIKTDLELARIGGTGPGANIPRC
ncbi:MAG TPA: transposase, partial [Ornithinicoccus sp.]|nr:transposase [Ornithinicoccus sp.]